MRRICTYVVLVCLGLVVNYTRPIQAAIVTDFLIPRNFTFSRDLVSGTSTSPDVQYLQNILNMSTSTQVAASGTGSNKSLTSFYGDKTKDAVGRFQARYAVDIAFEKSLATTSATSTVISSSTVGVFTRAVLNKLIMIYTDERDLYIKSITKFLPDGSDVRQLSSEEIAENAATGVYENAETSFQYAENGQIKKDSESSGTGKKVAIAGAAVVGAAAIGTAAVKTAVRPLNFGGQSVAMVPCACSANILLYVRDVRGPVLPLTYQPGVTVLYKMYQPRAGVNMLGQYVPGGVCLVYAGTGCVPGGTPIGTMVQLGTSLTLAPVK